MVRFGGSVTGSRRIAVPNTGVSLARCESCGLAYKAVVPTPSFLRTITTLEQSSLWQPKYDFAAELAAIKAHHETESYDLPDIGAAGSEFHRAARSGTGRRSALDVSASTG